MPRKPKLTTDPEMQAQDAQEGTPPAVPASQPENPPAETGQENPEKDKLLKENEELKKRLEEMESRESGEAAAPDRTEKVRITIPRDYKHKDDLTVGLNGTIYRFQRGKTVEVDKDVAEIIERSLEQDMRTDEMIRELVSDEGKGSKQ